MECCNDKIDALIVIIDNEGGIRGQGQPYKEVKVNCMPKSRVMVQVVF